MMQWLLSPLTWCLLCALLTLACWRRGAAWLRRALSAMTLLALLLMTPLAGNALVRLVEHFGKGTACDGQLPDAPVVVLSAGFDGDPEGEDAVSWLSAESWRRLRGAISYWRHTPAALLVISGGGPFPAREADALAVLARDWKVPAAQLRIERRSTNTWTSAASVHELVPARARIATSALHMPRALFAYRAAGFKVCGLPTGSDYNPPGGIGYFLPQTSGLDRSERAIYELLGLAWYRLRALRGPPTM